MCFAGRPSTLRGKNFSIGRKLFNHFFFLPAMLIDTINSYQFFSTFTDLDLAWGSQAQRKAKPISFILSHTFHLIRMKFDVMMKQFKLNVLRLL